MLQSPPLVPSPHAHTPSCSAGAPVTPFEHNWVILFRTGGSMCGASLIDEQWAMTAAHCTDGISASRRHCRRFAERRGCRTFISTGGLTTNSTPLSLAPSKSEIDLTALAMLVATWGSKAPNVRPSSSRMIATNVAPSLSSICTWLVFIPKVSANRHANFFDEAFLFALVHGKPTPLIV